MLGVRMAVLALRIVIFVELLMPLRDSVLDVLFLSSSPEMISVHTRRVVAAMTGDFIPF